MEGLSRHYGPVVALDRFDLTLQPGELIALRVIPPFPLKRLPGV
jgi:hypothetical protein